MRSSEFIEWCKYQHDTVCNQKYDGNLPYSKHLDFVHAQYKRFNYLIGDGWVDYGTWTVLQSLEMGCYGHDLIEDARVTYNDIVEKVGPEVAEVIFCCTETAGRTREERHDLSYYQRCASNRLAVFVKLCDIMANVTYSILTKSKMYKKHKAEHEKTMKYLYREEFKPMYDYLDKLFALW